MLKNNLIFALYKEHHVGHEFSLHEGQIVFEQYAILLNKALGSASYQTIYREEAGRLLPDGNWTGMIGLVNRSEADIALETFFITEERKEAASYSYPIAYEQTSFVTRKLEYNTNALTIFTPFSFTVWLILAASMLFMILALYFLLCRRGSPSRVAMVVLAAILSQSLLIKPRPKTAGERSLVLSWLVGATITVMCYKSLLLSVLTLPNLTGVKNLQELATAVEKGQYNCMAMEGSSLHNLLENSSIASERIIGHSIKKNPYGGGSVEHFLQLSNRKIAYIGSKREIEFLSDMYFMSKDSFYPTLVGLMVKKDFCCKKQLDRSIHRIQQAGLYEKLNRDDDFMTLLRLVPRKSSGNEGKRAKLDLVQVKSAFVILTTGNLVACIVIFMEVIINKLQK